MDWKSWILASWGDAVMAVASAAGIYIAVILFTRMAGLRSFSKMSSFDFAMTVAVGSLVATTAVSKDPPLIQAAVALGALYALQIGVAFLRERVPASTWLFDNEPILLMENGRMIREAMREAEITEADLLSKLREANVLRLREVRAVVLETTGDISVLHGDPEGGLDADVLQGVRGSEGVGS